MARPVVLSNGQMFVGLDENGLVHDFYYPYVGLENLTNARSSQHKIGLWVDNKFKWTNDGSFEAKLNIEEDALISNIELYSKDLSVRIRFHDYIDQEYNALIRNITIINEADNDRDIRLFMHQVFQISHLGRGDTAMFVPDGHYILDYKGRYCLLIGGKFNDGTIFDQYAVGNYGIEGKEGTFIDAEDGNLSFNAVEHGGVDSVIRFQKKIAKHASTNLDYWIIAGNNQNDIQSIHTSFNLTDMDSRRHLVTQRWQEWLYGSNYKLIDFHKKPLITSLLVIKAHCDDRGSILASGDSSIFNYGRDYYCYCWPRDAAYALWPLIRLGHFDEARLFFEFARDTMHPKGYLMHKYQPDRAIGSTWHPLIHGKNKELAIQEDETAIVIYMLGQYLEASNDLIFIKNMYHNFIRPCTNFLSDFIDDITGLPHASYDLWEEKFLTSTYTVSTVIGALQTAASIATKTDNPEDHVMWLKTATSISDNFHKLYRNNTFVKGFLLKDDGRLDYDETIDISNLYGPYMFAGINIDSIYLQTTAQKVEETIANVTPSGGVLRYSKDNYFLTKQKYNGNPWVVSSLWLAQYYIGSQQLDKAAELLNWSLDRRLTTGVLSEQFDPENASPISVTPLVWSHAEIINTILDLYKTKSENTNL